MDCNFSEEQLMLRESVRKLMARIATPDYIRRLDRERLYPYELYDAWAEGLAAISLTWPSSPKSSRARARTW